MSQLSGFGRAPPQAYTIEKQITKFPQVLIFKVIYSMLGKISVLEYRHCFTTPPAFSTKNR